MDALSNHAGITFEEFVETNDAKKVHSLRSQLAIVDRAIGLIARDNHVSSQISLQLEEGSVPKATEFTSQMTQSRSLVTHFGPTEPQDLSYKIDVMSSQLATCPQCLTEMDVKKLKSHISHSCPNKLIVCPELNCGCQLPLKHLRRHLMMECEITAKRRRLVDEAAQRKQAEADRAAAAAAEARLRRTQNAPPESTLSSGATLLPSASSVPEDELAPVEDFDDLESRHTVCPKCGEAMRQSQLTTHLAKLCSRRRVMCPNYHTGCQQRLVPLYLMQQHLASECAAERHREAMIARSQHRQELVKCPACGEQVALLNLRKHERELCSNRRVPCRNHPLGCTVMVRLRDRAQHERVDTKRALRPALYMPGHGAHLALREDDLACPWTAEYWIYRPPAKESLKTHLRNAFLLIPKYMVAFAAEVRVQQSVQKLVDALRNSGSANDALAAAEGGKLSKEQRALRAKELAQSRVDQVNALSALVPVYSEAVLAYTRAFQELAVSVEAGCACAEEILAAEVTRREPEAITLGIKYVGEVAAAPTLDFSFMKAKKRSGPDESAEDGSVGAKSAGVGSKASAPEDGVQLTAGSADGALLQDEQALLDGMEPVDVGGCPGEEDLGEEPEEEEEDWDLEGDLSVAAEQDELSGGEGAQTDVEDGEEPGQGQAAEEGGEHGAGSSVHTASTHGSRSQAGSVTAKDVKKPPAPPKPLHVDWAALMPYLFSGSSLGSMFQACLHAERPRAYQEAVGYLNSTCQHDQVPPTLVLHPELDLEYLLPPAREGEGEADHESNHGSFGPGWDAASSSTAGASAHQSIPESSISFAVRELQAQGIAAFLADVLVAPRRSGKDCALPWTSWQRVIQLLGKALKTDFDTLQDWRVDAGLLKPEYGTAGKAGRSKEANAKLEKAMEKKEKARMKRELKKQEKMLASHAPDGAAPSTFADSAGVPAPAQLGIKKDDALFKRMGDLLRAGCGAGVLAESTSRSAAAGERNYTKICLSLGSGLSLLLPKDEPPPSAGSRPHSRATSPHTGDRPHTATGSDGADAHGEHEDDEDHRNHHYELLLRLQDITKLARSAGQLGVVAIPHTLGELTGMGDYQLQQWEKQHHEEEEGSEGTDSSRPNSPDKASVVSTHSGDGNKGKSKHRNTKHKRSTKSAAGSGTGKKAASLVRAGMEARSFEVEVPRGRWTHLALVATALPQNRLTLYMDGLLVKTLKDCAFPLPMSALGGGTQSFESFEGALLDVRYWAVQRSSLELIDNMNKLLELEKDGIAGNNPPGLVAWWTFEDGGGKSAAADMTGHRFKTRILRRQAGIPPKTAHSEVHTRDHGPEGSRPGTHPKTASTSAGVGEEGGEGYFAAEERVRYRIPDDAAHMLPAAYFKLLPFHEPDGSDSHDLPEHQDSLLHNTATDHDLVLSRPNMNTTSLVPPPWETWMHHFPRWQWLNAETVPTPQLPAAVRKALEKASKAPGPPLSKSAAAADKAPAPPLPVDPKLKDDSGGRGVLPVPSLRAKGVCPYELRRHRLAAKGRELQREVECPLGCLEKVRSVDVRFHVRFSCPRRMTQCRFDYCQVIFPVEQRDLHERTDCRHFYARNKVLSMAELHRTIFPCSLCSEGVMQRDMEHHDKFDCPHRLVRCRYEDCEFGSDAAIPAHMLNHHLRYDCTSMIRKNRFLLVERARQRLNYPRPWGVDVTLDESVPNLDVEES